MDLTIENFTERTGFRFRISRDQKALIDDGQLTREQAFAEFLAGGGLERLQGRRPEIPDSLYLEDGLTLENFSDRVEAAIGVSRRFRVSREQHARIKDGQLTREQALAEVVSAKRAEATAATEATVTNEPEVATIFEDTNNE
ncbi:MAG: hypothetical protein K5880_14495 [Hydrogenophaga sp.]|nr:hypothetical protein [Hydrogenophaga sp.]